MRFVIDRIRNRRWSMAAGLFVLIAFLSITLAACSPAKIGDRKSALSPGGSWTLCLYLCGSNLESKQGWATKTLEELKDSRIPSNVNVVVQAGGARKWSNEDVQKNGQRFQVKSGELLDVGIADEGYMNDSDVLSDFLLFCQKEYPADHTAVVLWNHGGGPLKGVCFDETDSFKALTLAGLSEALDKGVEARGGLRYDIVGFDACLMGSLETAAAISNDADWMVASEEIETGAGWAYEPIIKAMGHKRADGRSVATAICDGYRKKSQRRGKDSAITLAALDLSCMPELVQSMEDVLTALRENVGSGIGILRRLAYGARFAEDFGGSSRDEGRSNLVDLKGLADGCAEAYGTDDVPWDKLSKAIDQMAVYRVTGTTTADANGISIWYPIALEDSGLDDYINKSPLTHYSAVLKELFSMDIGEVSFSDPGSVDEEGTFHITIDPASSDFFYDTYVVNRRIDGSYEDNNVDRIDDWDALSFSWQPKLAVECVLNGMPLDVSVVSYTGGYIVFSSPVQVNGEKVFLRFSWIVDADHPEGGYYEFLGIWNGTDHVSGLAERFLESLEPGDEIDALSLDGDEVRGSITVDGEIEISDRPMEPGEYECRFIALDLYGREYPSAVCGYTVDEAGNVTVQMRD